MTVAFLAMPRAVGPVTQRAGQQVRNLGPMEPHRRSAVPAARVEQVDRRVGRPVVLSLTDGLLLVARALAPTRSKTTLPETTGRLVHLRMAVSVALQSLPDVKGCLQVDGLKASHRHGPAELHQVRASWRRALLRATRRDSARALLEPLARVQVLLGLPPVPIASVRRREVRLERAQQVGPQLCPRAACAKLMGMHAGAIWLLVQLPRAANLQVHHRRPYPPRVLRYSRRPSGRFLGQLLVEPCRSRCSLNRARQVRASEGGDPAVASRNFFDAQFMKSDCASTRIWSLSCRSLDELRQPCGREAAGATFDRTQRVAPATIIAV